MRTFQVGSKASATHSWSSSFRSVSEAIRVSVISLFPVVSTAQLCSVSFGIQRSPIWMIASTRVATGLTVGPLRMTPHFPVASKSWLIHCIPSRSRKGLTMTRRFSAWLASSMRQPLVL